MDGQVAGDGVYDVDTSFLGKIRLTARLVGDEIVCNICDILPLFLTHRGTWSIENTAEKHRD